MEENKKEGKDGHETVGKFLFFLIGMSVGGCVAVILLCCLQINRINALESEIRRLKSLPRKESQADAN